MLQREQAQRNSNCHQNPFYSAVLVGVGTKVVGFTGNFLPVCHGDVSSFWVHSSHTNYVFMYLWFTVVWISLRKVFSIAFLAHSSERDWLIEIFPLFKATKDAAQAFFLAGLDAPRLSGRGLARQRFLPFSH